MAICYSYINTLRGSLEPVGSRRRRRDSSAFGRLIAPPRTTPCVVLSARAAVGSKRLVHRELIQAASRPRTNSSSVHSARTFSPIQESSSCNPKGDRGSSRQV